MRDSPTVVSKKKEEKVSRKNRRITGDIGEEAVAGFLASRGYEILERNYTVRGGEIDIIAKKDDTLCFVEVKTRRGGAMVSGEQAVTPKKRQLIIRAAEMYMLDYREKYGEIGGRFDVCAVTLENGKVTNASYYKAAFDASDTHY